MSKWQPIETAPKDGTVIDLWVVVVSEQRRNNGIKDDPKEWREVNAFWVEGGWDEGRDGHYQRDGWMAPGHDYDGASG